MTSRKHEYQTQGTCSRKITIWSDGDVIRKVQFCGGCPGNLTGIARLVQNRPIREVAELLEGVDCDGRGTSCSDQLARALKEIIDS